MSCQKRENSWGKGRHTQATIYLVPREYLKLLDVPVRCSSTVRRSSSAEAQAIARLVVAARPPFMPHTTRGANAVSVDESSPRPRTSGNRQAKPHCSRRKAPTPVPQPAKQAHMYAQKHAKSQKQQLDQSTNKRWRLHGSSTVSSTSVFKPLKANTPTFACNQPSLLCAASPREGQPAVGLILNPFIYCSCPQTKPAEQQHTLG